MSSHSYSKSCPHCEAEDSLMVSEDTRPPTSDAICVECGYGYRTVHEVYDLEETNYARDSQGLPLLRYLPTHNGMEGYIAEVPK